MMKQIAILIPTLPVRIDKYAKLIKELNRQIVEAKLVDKIQIISLCDTKEYVVGKKRNYLLSLSLAKYICYIDDDDWIAKNYIKKIYEASLKGKDCVTFLGTYSSNQDKRTFDISIKHKHDHNTNECFYRIPNHLAVIKREIAVKCPFPHLQYGEDSQYAKYLQKHLKTEYQIREKLYFYNFDIKTSQTDPKGNANQFQEFNK